MVSSRKMTPWLMAFICLATAGCSNVTDQNTSESQNDQQVAILKQIRKVNEDGSYTFGFEATDGSFKVETRDVLGNIKGTFGFVDANGEVKRVSYSSSNGTGFKATTLSPLQEQVSVVQSIPRLNRTSTTRKPSLVYATTTESALKGSVVQAIPTRSRKLNSFSTSTTTTTTETPTKPLHRQYLRTTARSRPKFIINGQQRPLTLEDETDSGDSQIHRPNTEEKSATNYRKLAKRPIDRSLRPITEEFEDIDEDGKATTGNTLRRQLPETSTKPPSPIMEISSDDHADVYGGALSTTRPLFTTNSVPRILQRIVDRNERPKALYVSRDNVGPSRFDESKYEGGQVLESEVKSSQEDPNQILVRTTPRPPPPESRDYVRQNSEPIYVQRQPELYPRDPANHEDDPPAYRAVPIGRILFRPLPNQQPVYTTTTDANLRYLVERPDQEPMDEPRVAANPTAFVRPRVYQTYAPEHDPRMRPVLMRTVPRPQLDDRDSDYVYKGAIALPPEPPNPIAPPLSRRDFQVLLKRLLISQYGVQALNSPKAYLEDALYDQQSYPSHQRVYQTPIPRDDIYETTTVPVYGDRVPLRRPSYVRALYEDYPEGRYAKRVYRQRVYTQDVTDDGDEILPAPIREALLLRMLQLVMEDRPPVQSTTPAYRKTGPVRSVQIISDGEDEKDIVVRKKI